MIDFSVYYWNHVKNVGDYYTCWLLEQMLPKTMTFHRSDSGVDLAATGSILEHKCITKNTIIAGGGWHNYNYGAKFNGDPKNVLGVRGKLTKNFLKLSDDVCLGDPGLLVSKYYNPKVEKKYNYGLICHWRDIEYFSKKYANTGLKIIRTDTYDVEAFVREIKECEFIFSTSLHGIIFSHAYGIPAVHVEKQKLESRGNFKFKDYFSVLDIEYHKIEFDENTSFLKLYRNLSDISLYRPSNKVLVDIQENLEKMLKKSFEIIEQKYMKVQNTKICLCGIAKCENNYIKEWVEHYKQLGFDKIYLYDNNDIDGEHFEDVIGNYIDNKFVELINVRGMSNQQIFRYNEFYHSIANNYDYVAYFDIDEFLFLKDESNIKSFVLDNRFNGFDAIAVNWKYFDDNNIATVKGFSVKKRFTHEYREDDWQYSQCKFTKRIIKTKLEDCIVNSSHGPLEKAQMSEYSIEKSNKLKVCNTNGVKVYNSIVLNNWTHDTAYLAHYRFKTIEEYINNKMKRGYPTLYKNSGKDMNIDDFFKLNTVTLDKLAVVIRLFNLNEKERRELIVKYRSQLTEEEKSSNLYYELLRLRRPEERPVKKVKTGFLSIM